MTRLLPLACALALAMPSVRADDGALDPTIVTASRTPEPVASALATSVLLDRAAIERSGARNLLDLLRVQAGIDLARTGGPGGSTSLFLRGTNSNHVLVLVDGVRVASFATGALDWANLPIVQVERVEIVRGPRAAYWGSDAIGGVIQIFTRRLDGPLLAVEAGSYGTRRGQAGYGHDGERGHLSAFYADDRSDGFSAQNADGFSFHPDDDGQRQQSLTVQGGLAVGAGHSLDARFFRADSEAEFDAGEREDSLGPARSDARTQSAALSLAGALAPNWQHQLVLADARDDLDTPINGSSFRTERRSIDWQHALGLAAGHTLVFGVNWLDEEGRADDGFAPPYGGERDNGAAYLGWRASFGAIDTELVGRYDDNSEFGGEFTGSAALGWRIGERVRLTAGFGEGFRAPNLNELYSPGYEGLFAGNPELEPERSRSAEIGADLDFAAAGNLRLRAFRMRVRDLISFTGGELLQAENVARASIDGVEAEYALIAGDWLLNATATVQDPENDDTGQPLLRRAKRKASFSLDRSFGAGVSAGAEVLAVGEREDAGFPSNVILPGYGIVNLRAAWRATPDWTVELRADNLADKDYALIHGFNTPGRSAYLGVRWQPLR